MTEEKNIPEENTEAESEKLKAKNVIENISAEPVEQLQTENMEAHHPHHEHHSKKCGCIFNEYIAKPHAFRRLGCDCAS